MEGVDQPSDVTLVDSVIHLNDKTRAGFSDEYAAGLLDGVVVLHCDGGVLEKPSAEEALYMPASPTPPKTRPAKLGMIPYYAWANRQPTVMQVWIHSLRT
jgi:hypothetical protein